MTIKWVNVGASDYRATNAAGETIGSAAYCPPAREWFGWVMEGDRAVGAKLTAPTLFQLRGKVEAAIQAAYA